MEWTLTSLWGRCGVRIATADHIGHTIAEAQLDGLLSGSPTGVATATIAVLLGVAAACRLPAFLKYSRMRRHGLLTALATMLPPSLAVSWLNEMQAQLDERRKCRLALLADFTVHGPVTWWVSWTVHLRQAEARRIRGNEVRLVARLRDALEPRPDLHISVAALEVLGLSRAMVLRPTRMVPALATARRLLELRTPGLGPIEENLQELLLARERASRNARNLRRHQLTTWPGKPEDSLSHQQDEQNRLHDEVVVRATALRAALRAYAADHSIGDTTVD